MTGVGLPSPAHGRWSDRGHEEHHRRSAADILADKELKQPGKANERRQLLEKVVGDRFDYQEMSRRSMGAPWNNLPDKDKQEFVSLFQTLLVNSYADKIESYSGEGVQYINERTEKDYAEVRTKVLTGKTEIPLDYRLLNKGSDWRVYDVVVDGVSLVNNYRGQFSKDPPQRQLRRPGRPAPQEVRQDQSPVTSLRAIAMTILRGIVVFLVCLLAGTTAAVCQTRPGLILRCSRFRRRPPARMMGAMPG